MIARILWFAALFGVALMTIGVQLDRQARKTPSLAASVPGPFRSDAQLPLAAYATDTDSPEAALREARKLVLRRPMPAEHLRVLAQAQFAAGDLDASALTIQYAAQRGWRDPLAQESMVQLALSAGDAPEAARRYAALFLMREIDEALLEELGKQVLAEAGGAGRTTLVGIVSGGDRWHSLFLARGARVMPPDAFSEIAGAAMANGATFDCGRLEAAVRSVARKDSSAAGQLVANAQGACPGLSR